MNTNYNQNKYVQISLIEGIIFNNIKWKRLDERIYILKSANPSRIIYLI